MHKHKKIKEFLSIFLILTVFTLSMRVNSYFSTKTSYYKSYNPKTQSIIPGTYLNYGVGSLIFDLDPHQAWDSASIRIIDQVCEGLFAYNLSDPELSIIPVLAENMGSWSPDGKTFTVPLKQGVTFHDGSAFTADDVKWSFDRLNNLINAQYVQISSLYEPLAEEYPETPLLINETIVDNQYQVTFKLNYPFMSFIPLLCFSGSYILPSDAGYPYNDLLNTTTDILIGTGPYQYIQNNLLDGFEIKYGTDPLVIDTDGDGYGDGVEILSGSNPLDANDYPGSQNGDDTTTDDTATDDTATDDTATDDTATDDTATDDTATDDTQSSPFDNIPGYSQGILIGISFIAIMIIYIKKRR
ncbi:MAG: ABC transporter substrate-binding protein [Candidatus Lokiarchaeota archaeon]|nr:ABC transporter substrate-binding protein [Candidatus Harpocratesius repetitus]